MITTLGQTLINEALPPELRDYKRKWTKKEVQNVLQEVATKHPDQYKEVVHKLMRIGQSAATTGNISYHLKDFMPSPLKKREKAQLALKVQEILDKSGSDEDKNTKVVELLSNKLNLIDDLMAEGVVGGNRLAEIINSGAKGSPGQYNTTVGIPLLFTNHRGDPIPIPVLNSAADGLDPVEFFASTFGTRRGVISTKFATQDAGAFAKQLAKANQRMTVTEEDCGTGNGITVDGYDEENVGTVLQYNVGDLQAGRILNPDDLKKLKGKQVIVRSPSTCQAEHGICAKCAGVRDRGTLPEIGDNIGISASQSLSEKLSQGSLNVKHCLTPWTEVLCADWSTKRMDEITVGDMVMGADAQGRLSPTMVVNVYDNGPQECYRTAFIPVSAHKSVADKVVLESTLKHKILGTRFVYGQEEEDINGEVRKLEVGQRSRQFYAARPTGFDDTGLVDEPFALLCGLLLGDGCYTEAVKSVNFSTADEQLVKELKPYLKSIGLSLTKLKGHKYYYSVSTVEDVADHDELGRFCLGARNPAKKFLSTHELMHKYAHEKTIPSCVATWSNDSVAALIAGLIITDGTVYPSDNNSKPGIGFGSTSRALMDELRCLLGMRFGVWMTEPTKTAVAGTRNYVHDMWQMTVTRYDQVERFYNNIPLLGEKKTKLKELVDAYVPPERKTFTGLKRTSQEFIGVHPTLDLEVDNDDHLFVLANGLIVSNSGGALSKKHNFTFEDVNRLFQMPKRFPHSAAVSSEEGTVKSIKQSEGGGAYVIVGNSEHYVDNIEDVKVKPGDHVEAGDLLSDGIANPKEIAKYRGIGAARRSFIDEVRRITNNGVSRRNAEVLARSVVSHVRINSLDGPAGTQIGDVVRYDDLVRTYEPREGTRELPLGSSVGKYLEKPTLHYTIGTRVTDRVSKDLKKAGVNSIFVHEDAPAFDPDIQRIYGHPQLEPDWMTRLSGTELKKSLLKSVHEGASAPEHATSFVPALAKGVDFGKDIATTGTY